MRSGKPLFLEIVDKSIGLLAGQRATLRVHASGWQPQRGSARLEVNDAVGARHFLESRDDVSIEAGPADFEFVWEIPDDAPPGRYSVTATLFGGTENIRSVVSDDFEVLAVEVTSPGRFPALPRDRTISCLYDFEPVRRKQLVDYFQVCHEICEQDRNPDGSWGKGYNSQELSFHPLYRSVANIILGYLIGYRLFGEETYRDRAVGGLHYLLDEQEPNGAYRWWYTREGVLNDRDCFYSSGWAALALVEGYRMLGDERCLSAVRRVADWTVRCPATGNNNYDAFALWFLGPLFEITGEEAYLESAVRRTEEAIFVAQCPHGGYPGHNSYVGYQLIILKGLASLHKALPRDHPFAPALRRRLILATNNVIYKQSDSGAVYGGWEYNPEFTIDEHSRPVGRVSSEPFPYALYLAWRELNFDRRFFDGMCRVQVSHVEDLKGMSHEERDNRAKLLEPATLLRWYDELEREGTGIRTTGG